MPSLFPEPNDLPPQVSRLAPKLRALADECIYFGTLGQSAPLSLRLPDGLGATSPLFRVVVTPTVIRN
jgi:hypothetical protein